MTQRDRNRLFASMVDALCKWENDIECVGSVGVSFPIRLLLRLAKERPVTYAKLIALALIGDNCFIEGLYVHFRKYNR